MKRFKQWNRWRKGNRNSVTYKICVLLGLAHSPSFDFMRACDLMADSFIKAFCEASKGISKAFNELPDDKKKSIEESENVDDGKDDK